MVSSHSLGGLGRRGGSGSLPTWEVGSRARFSWLVVVVVGWPGVASYFWARRGLSHRVPRQCRARLPRA